MPTHSVPPIPSSALPRVTHACTHTHTRTAMHSHKLTHIHMVHPTASPTSHCPCDARPPCPDQTCSHPCHALSLDKYVQAPVPHAHVHAFTIFFRPSLPHLPGPHAQSRPTCTRTRIHMNPHPHAHVPPDPHAPSPWCSTHARIACLFVLFSCNTFLSLPLYIYRIFVFQAAKKEGT